MDWLTQTFNNESIAWLIILATITLISGFLSSWFSYFFIRRRELNDIQKLDDDKQRNERIRREMVRWANPVLASVRDLQSQLRNIHEHGGYLAMGKDFTELINPNWSISYEYFMSSVPFLFGQYFAWVQMLQDELNFELFDTQIEKDSFFNAIHNVTRALSSFPPVIHYDCIGKDTQVFALQQRAMGELLIIREGECKRCMSYPEFISKMSNEQFQYHFQPLIIFLDGIRPDDDCRWNRLKTTIDSLGALEKVCKDLLNLQQQSD